MNLSELLRKEMIEKVEADKKQAGELFVHAEKDLKVAEDNFKINNYDWSLAIAYNAMLSAGRALMAVMGYRAKMEAHHLAVVQFCAAVMPAESTQLIAAFNRYRARRHEVVYGETETVGKDEAKRALDNAMTFLKKIKEKI
ncbi:MAG: HEPN domain-containing protein [Candidatus Micrarchaeota archaeon]